MKISLRTVILLDPWLQSLSFSRGKQHKIRGYRFWNRVETLDPNAFLALGFRPVFSSHFLQRKVLNRISNLLLVTDDVHIFDLGVDFGQSRFSNFSDMLN